MSRSYQIRVSESETRTVHVDDGIDTRLEVLPILPTDRMGAHLASELEKQGFTRDGDTMTQVDKDGMTVSVNLRTNEVSVRLASKKEVTEEVEMTSHGYEEDGQGGQKQREDKLRDQAKVKIDDKIKAQTEKLRKEITKKLEKKLESVQKDLDNAVQDATISALKEKASQLGEISNVDEDQAGNVTIRVQLPG